MSEEKISITRGSGNVFADLGRIAGNPFLSALSSLIEVALVAALIKSSPIDEDGGVERSAAEHRAIIDAIALGDEAAARAAMRHVIEEGIRHANSGPSTRR